MVKLSSVRRHAYIAKASYHPIISWALSDTARSLALRLWRMDGVAMGPAPRLYQNLTVPVTDRPGAVLL